jgi:excinuclease ABC subunit C
MKITEETFPRLLVARRNRAGEFIGPKGRVYGPFVRGSSKYLTIGLLRKLFKIRICNRLPKSPCLQYFIKNCDAPCIDNVTKEQYMSSVSSLHEILEGRRSIERFAKEMEAEMKTASDSGDYERAKAIRDTLYRLNNLRVRQKMEKTMNRNPDEEYIGIMEDRVRGVAHVMTLRRTRGVISDRKKFQFDLVGDNSLSSFLIQYYTSVPVIPGVIYLNEEVGDHKILELSLGRVSGHKVGIVTIGESGRGEKRQLMELILRNISLYIERGYNPAVVELKARLGLDVMPEVMDCFDVSNLGNTIAVGSCIRFVDGKPEKSMYRKFRIRSIAGQNDFAMIGELVRRRYSDKLSEKLPDLIVVDGGSGQLGAATSSLRSMGILNLPCIGLAKENEEVYFPKSNEPLVLARDNVGLKLLQHIRDEAHRFGLAYNARLRKLK